MAKIQTSERFDIHASVIYQLGESLVTDSIQALVELVKNSYDADATYCKLSILTGNEAPGDSSIGQSNGWIVIEDNGTGMDKSDIKRGWLTISDSPKRQFKKRRLITSRGRTPLGDKGLGRLSAQRLGGNLEMVTRKKGSELFHLLIKWADFASYERLSEVPVLLESEESNGPIGTKLIISNLIDPNAWRGESLRELERRLSQLISPYKEVRDFQVHALADGVNLDLAAVSSRLRNAAQLRYKFNFESEIFSIHGKVRQSYFRPQRNSEFPIFKQLMEDDNGEGFLNYLKTLSGWKRFSVFRSKSESWYLEFESAKGLEEFADLDRIEGSVASPGPFHGEVDSFNLAQSPEHSVFGSAAELKKVVELLSGIRVYRDGFGIRVNPDWLNLAEQWTGGGSWYGLRPKNTIGYIAISAKDNECLQETTDREGFRETAHYINFYEILQSFVKFAGDAQEFFRRSWSDYRKRLTQVEADVASETSPESVAKDIASALSRSASYRISLKTISEKLNQSINRAQNELSEAQQNSRLRTKQVIEAVEQLRASIFEAASTVREVESYLDELSGIEKKARVVADQIQALRDQIQQVYEVIGLGMTAEALTHELENIATQLSRRTQEIDRYVKSHPRDNRVLNYLEHVKSAIQEFRRQLTFLAPSLKFVREQRDRIDLSAFTKEIFEYYTKRFRDFAIGVEPRNRSRTPFLVAINKGKLIQIFDNLFLNSEYWLKEDLKAARISKGTITLELEKPFVRVSDNGRGIDPLLEDSIFEAFVSAKGRGKGRGLGLFIVRQLLDAEGCSIDLTPERNKFDRLFKFEIDFTGVLSD